MLEFFYTIIIYPITQILEFTFFVSRYLFIESGISVIFVSVVISVLCLPLYAVAEKWQQIQRDIENKLKIKVDKIKTVFKGDEQYMILSTFYRQNNYHPIFALRSSFGLFIQIPFFIAAYTFLSQLELLQDNSFYFINNLGSPDALILINGISINILPVVMTLINCLAGALYTKGFPIKDKLQLYGMALVFLVLLYNSPSALVLYWTINNIFSFLKNIYYKMQFKNKRCFLMILFSITFLISSFFFKSKYGYSSKGLRLMITCIFLSLIPWLFLLIKKYYNRLFSIENNSKKHLLITLSSGILIFILFGLFIPSQLVSSSPQEFAFIDNYENPLYFIYYTALQFFGLFVFWPLCLYFLFSDTFKNIFTLAYTAFSFCIIGNVFLFPGNYGILSINFYFNNSPNHSIRDMILNIIILLIILSITFFISIRKKKNIILTIIFLSIFSISSISLYNIIGINTSYNNVKTFYKKEKQEIKNIFPLFPFSRNGKNVVVIMLDRAISVFIPYLLEELPELKEKYSGFIYYPNTVSFHGYTSGGAPPVYGGYEYTPDEIYKDNGIPIAEKYNQSLLLLPRIFSENGTHVSVTDPPYANLNWLSDLSIYENQDNIYVVHTNAKYTEIWVDKHRLNLPKTSAVIKRNMAWYSFFKGIPLMFRDLIYIKGNWCSPILNNNMRLALNSYAVLDFLPLLTKIVDENIDTALILTNNTTHEFLFFQAPEYVPAINVTNYGTGIFSKDWAYHVNAAALKRLADWFDYLKEEKVYDNTRIILVSDHGPEPNFVTKIGLPFNVDQFNPLLMVKDFDAAESIKTDMTFMSNADVPSLALNKIIDNPINPFTGNPVNMDKKNEPLYIVVSGSMHISDKKSILGKNNYMVKDNIFLKENWTPSTSE